MNNLRVGPIEIVLLCMVALGLAVAMTVGGKSSLVIGIVVAGALMVSAFLSTPFSLYLLVFSFLLGPEFMFGGEFTTAQNARGKQISVGHGMTLRFDDFLLIVMALIWLVKAAIHKEESPFKFTRLNSPILVYTAACFLATLIGVLVGRVKPLPGFFFNLKYFEYFFIYFMVINVVTSTKMAKGLITASLITCVLVSLFAIGQVPSGERASAPFEGAEGEPNTLGGYLVLMLSIAAGILLTPGAYQKKWPYITVLVIGLFALLATLSRSSYASAAIVIVIVLLMVSFRRPLLFTMVLAIIGTSPLWMPNVVKERVMFTFTQSSKEVGQEKIGGVRIDTSSSERLRSWQHSKKYFMQSPVVGMGVTGGPFMDAMYPRVLTETGLLGLVAFLFLCLKIAQVAWTTWYEAPDPLMRGVALGFLLGFVGMLVHALGSNTFIIVRIMEPFWLIAALVVKGMMLTEGEGTATAESQTAAVAAVPQVQAGLGWQGGIRRA